MTYMCIYMPRCIMSFLFFRVRVFLIVPLYFYPSFFFFFATWFDPCFGILHRNFDVSICLYVNTQWLIDWFVFCERTWEQWEGAKVSSFKLPSSFPARTKWAAHNSTFQVRHFSVTPRCLLCFLSDSALESLYFSQWLSELSLKLSFSV